MIRIGTNYYVACVTCARPIYHIGKQSYGWNFKSNISKEEFKKLNLNKGEILTDEYGTVFGSKDELFEVTSEKWELHEDAKRWWNSGDDGWC